MTEKEILKAKEHYTFDDLIAIMRILRSEDGCPWDRAQTHESLIPCLMEEASEVEAAIQNRDMENLCEELGDLLFSCVNAARHLGIDAELALKSATDKFILRFSKTEELVASDSLDMKELTIEELDVYWDKSKKLLKNNGGN